MTEARPADICAAELRSRALEHLARTEADERSSRSGPPTDAQHQHSLHELRVHQIELELQNEELRRTQLALEVSRQRWFELYDLAPVGYCTVSEGGLILQVNLAAAELFKQPRAALAQRRFSEFIHPDDQPGYGALRARLRESLQPQTCELRLLEPPGPQGPERWVLLTATAAETGAADARGLRIVLQDISARRQAQAAQAALRLAQQTQRHQSEFLSRVSHEFRTPLNAIKGFSHLLMRDDDLARAQRARGQIQHILDAGNHLLRMVTDLLDLSSAESGRLALQLTSVDARHALNDALRDVAAQAQAAGVSLALDGPAGATAGVRADPTRLRQVLQNLLSNAVKYNRAGGWVRARLARNGAHWRVHIADNGIGMTPDQQAALFQPFNRLGREAAGIEGTGLGLVIARDLIHAMGGHLTVRSEAGQGSEFVIDLVAAEAVGHDAPGAADAAGLPTRTDVTGRVLCVEGDRANGELMRSILDCRPGIDTEIVNTGAACIAAARSRWPSLLLLDLRLPDMRGLDVLKVLRQINPHLPLRCLVVSADNSADEIAQARAAGSDGHLAKPIAPEQLLSAIDRLLGAAAQP